MKYNENGRHGYGASGDDESSPSTVGRIIIGLFAIIVVLITLWLPLSLIVRALGW